jgi:hypothetical protein
MSESIKGSTEASKVGATLPLIVRCILARITSWHNRQLLDN